MGVHVGIDDLGTGHSGLSYMLKLGVDFIKIDKMFVDAIGTERYSTTIIETLVGLGRDMSMEIIAEGVETFEQVQHLRERGIRKAQGYVFAPPLPGASSCSCLKPPTRSRPQTPRRRRPNVRINRPASRLPRPHEEWANGIPNLPARYLPSYRHNWRLIARYRPFTVQPVLSG